MRQPCFSFACYLVGSLFFAQMAAAQTDRLAAELPARSIERLHLPANEGVTAATQVPSGTASQQVSAAHAAEASYEATAELLPVVQIFPTNCRAIWPLSYLLRGLLGLMLLGIILAALSSFQKKRPAS